jgi:hypothetical protein
VLSQVEHADRPFKKITTAKIRLPTGKREMEVAVSPSVVAMQQYSEKWPAPAAGNGVLRSPLPEPVRGIG